jgi:hypothetical protein
MFLPEVEGDVADRDFVLVASVLGLDCGRGPRWRRQGSLGGAFLHDGAHDRVSF